MLSNNFLFSSFHFTHSITKTVKKRFRYWKCESVDFYMKCPTFTTNNLSTLGAREISRLGSATLGRAQVHYIKIQTLFTAFSKSININK